MMEENRHFVGIAQAYIDSGDAIFVARALGSCVAVAIYSPFTKVGGMAHVLLPGSAEGAGETNKMRNDQVARRAEDAIDYLVSGIKKRNERRYGDRHFVLRAKIAGGAEMFPQLRGRNSLSMGLKNVRSVQNSLKRRHITIMGEDVGGNWGRNVFFHLNTGKMLVEKIHGNTIEL